MRTAGPEEIARSQDKGSRPVDKEDQLYVIGCSNMHICTYWHGYLSIHWGLRID